MYKPCPRSGGTHIEWRENGTCQYCGSIKPEDFLEYVKKGYPVGATDKSYKAYIQSPNPTAGEPCICMTATHPAEDRFQVTEENRETLPKVGAYGQKSEPPEVGDYTKISKQSPMRHHKFYFQHLSDAQMAEFIQLHNEGKFVFDGGFGFYAMPYFCKRAER